MNGADVFISESEIDDLETVLLEHGRSFTPNQDEADFEEPYDAVASTVNAIILRWQLARRR